MGRLEAGGSFAEEIRQAGRKDVPHDPRRGEAVYQLDGQSNVSGGISKMKFTELVPTVHTGHGDVPSGSQRPITVVELRQSQSAIINALNKLRPTGGLTDSHIKTTPPQTPTLKR